MQVQINPQLEFIRQLTDRITDRAVRGNNDYQRDMNLLSRYISIVRDIGDSTLEAKILNAIAMVHAFAGHLDAARKQFRIIFEFCRSIENSNGMVNALHNEAELLMMRHAFADTFSIYDEIQQVIRQYGDEKPSYTVRSYVLSRACAMKAMLACGYNAMAKASFQYLKDITTEYLQFDPEGYANAMVYAYPVMSEIHANEGRWDEALSFCQIGLEFAEGLKKPHEVAVAQFYRAHLEWLQGHLDEAECWWSKGETTLKTSPPGVLVGIEFAAEAFHLRRKGIYYKVETFTQDALDIFQHYQADECIAFLRQAEMAL